MRFRCYQCSKLLGAPVSKAGRTTTCPNCKAELIVPDPSAEPEPEETIPQIDLTEPTRTAAAATPKRDPSLEPGFSWEEIDTALFKSAVAIEPSISAVPQVEPTPESITAPPILLHPPMVDIDLAAPTVNPPGIPEIALDVTPDRIEAQARRRRGDIMLPQSVLVSWSIFVLLALAVSFLAGLFAGHFLWKIH